MRGKPGRERRWTTAEERELRLRLWRVADYASPFDRGWTMCERHTRNLSVDLHLPGSPSPLLRARGFCSTNETRIHKNTPTTLHEPPPDTPRPTSASPLRALRRPRLVNASPASRPRAPLLLFFGYARLMKKEEREPNRREPREFARRRRARRQRYACLSPPRVVTWPRSLSPGYLAPTLVRLGGSMCLSLESVWIPDFVTIPIRVQGSDPRP